MHDLLLAFGAQDSGAELKEAARVSGDDDFGFHTGDVLHFVVEQLERGFGLRDVVDAGGAATNVGMGKLDEFEARNLFQEIARSVANFLPVEQVAGILIGDPEIERLERAQRRGESEGSEIFGDIPDFGLERDGLRVLGFFLGEEVIVLLERGAAAGGVGDDGVEFLPGEGE